MNNLSEPASSQAPPAPTPSAGNALTRNEILRAILLAVFLLCGLLVLHAIPWGRKATFGNIEAFREWLAQWGGWAWLVFLVLGTAMMMIGLPRLIMAAAAGAMFGVIGGTILAEVVATLSAVPAFYCTYFLGRDLLARRLGNLIGKCNVLLGRHGFVVILLMRICPVGHSFLTNSFAGMTAIPFKTFMVASAIGFFPLNFIFALIGGGFVAHFQLRLWAGCGLLVGTSLFLAWYFRHSTLARDVMEVMRSSKSKGENLS